MKKAGSEEEEILKFSINEKYLNHFILTNEGNNIDNAFIHYYINETKNFENNIYQNFF